MTVIEGYKTTFGKKKPTDAKTGNVDGTIKPTDAKAEKPAENNQLKTEFDKITAQVKQFQQSKDASERERMAFELGKSVENWEDLYNAGNDADKKAATTLFGNIQKLKAQLGKVMPAQQKPADAKPETAKDKPADAKPETAQDKPADAKPETAQDKPADAKPETAQDKPADAKPETAQDKPADAKPETAQDKPADAKPETAQDKPADAKPETAQDKPADAKPETAQDKPADAKPETANEKPAEEKTTTKLSGSVGQGGANSSDDTKLIQNLLNKNGASPALVVDGIVGPKTIAAISQFQSSKLGFSDGLVEVNKKTWNALNGVTETKPADATNKPADATNKPADATNKPADATNKPADATNKPADATNKPADTNNKPADTNNPAANILNKTVSGTLPATEKPAEDKPLVPSTTLSASVGEGGTNKPEDVALVKTLITKFVKGLDLNDKANLGKVGPTTIKVIKEFQQTKVGITNPDGRIDVGGKSWKVLNGETKPVESVSAAAAGGNAALAQEVANSAESIASSRNTVGYCYGAVADAVERVMGKGIYEGNSAYMAAGQMASKPHLFKEISASPSNVRSLPVGTIVVWAAGGGPHEIHGHIMVCLGGGQEASDHINAAYNWPDGRCRAFLPIANNPKTLPLCIITSLFYSKIITLG